VATPTRVGTVNRASPVAVPGGREKDTSTRRSNPGRMRDEEEIREQYEFLKSELEDEEMNHEGVRQMFTYYKRALGWVLEEEYI